MAIFPDCAEPGPSVVSCRPEDGIRDRWSGRKSLCRVAGEHRQAIVRRRCPELCAVRPPAGTYDASAEPTTSSVRRFFAAGRECGGGQGASRLASGGW